FSSVRMVLSWVLCGGLFAVFVAVVVVCVCVFGGSEWGCAWVFAVLLFSRGVGAGLMLGDDVPVSVLGVAVRQVLLGVGVPRGVSVHRLGLSFGIHLVEAGGAVGAVEYFVWRGVVSTLGMYAGVFLFVGEGVVCSLALLRLYSFGVVFG
ncbi:carbon storage regulator, partial [endosymbiont of Riftia pachyptila]|uniref:carbon storage regulator n=1 Tax=endosymbiont of Riftia pachyptila TaxID=54396 RepID=UPI003B8471E0